MKLTALDRAANIMRLPAYIAVFSLLLIVSMKALPLLERTVVVLEHLDERVERATEALAPLGKEGIDKGIDTIKSLDGDQIGRDITDAIRRKLEEKK